ncbi:hypothetical protein [Priestia megaterium]
MTPGEHRGMISLIEEADEYLQEHMRKRSYLFPRNAIVDIVRRYKKLK